MDLREAVERVRRRLADLFAPAADLDPPLIALSEEDVGAQLATHRSALFLGLWDEAQAVQALERLGVLAAVRARAGGEVRLRLLPEDDVLRAYRADRPEGPDALLVEVKERLERATPPALRALGFPPGDLLVVDTILMQDPGRPFRPGRRALPGQRHPGLGVGAPVVEAFRATARALRAIGVVGVPQYFHTAVLYHRRFAFADPVAEGRFQALQRDLEALAFEEAAWAIQDGRVRDATFDEPLGWSGQEMIMPLSDAARAHFATPRYIDAAARTLHGTRFAVARG